MIKKIIFLTALILTSIIPMGSAGVDGHTEKGVFARKMTVLGRGMGNIIGLPLEIPNTIKRETEIHPKLWPITFIPRWLTNTAVRLTSAVNDIVFYPWIVPFTDDLSPLTESYDLPDYPWQGK